ncbi:MULTISPECIES: ABC transporter ATP-binding protein [unclassified Mesorhizobium]|uniref:ABC transporter ATP-binding protein n=1 Tax=unclassified Mesorhizobium TaxID=325217 RepID=UPI000FCB48EF|nr:MULTISPECIES: ABC transporter ATP-binding protein [unclassified Mesorhizobium]RUX03418.1 ABC transporter ATP-binding protein [Mesorhizobium sp. M8A.F.Ca.ET.023.01.1.1]RUX07280.1 ABC transporter ATP-binding protein [Mesorhizobium sp. M8A.F.Ca.ET.059.01.1.1]TGU99589.1 ABC transporter ATP-binding protein [Mesorhizobium sp. M00.F.Ca.ET.151.01.1.1]TGV15378.1 ABC transporter ATP-binding protein [Mesorhizobium sp. M8A.F.Ca.ET.173.01.1.1]RUW46719.1 ABC transporter ATP-binding protein [Mesorhizobium
MNPILTVEGVTAGYGRVTVLHDISMEAGRFGNVGLFGPNGHGKTTLLRAISGLLRPKSGRILFDGQDISGLSARAIVGTGLIHVPQGNRLFPDLSIADCMKLGAYSPRARPHEAENREKVIRLFPKLAERWRQRVRTLSGGERQMVSIGTALMSHPRLLILDEPTLGLAPKIKDELCASVMDISRGGVPLIVVEQDIEFLLELTQQLYLVNHGAVATEIKPGESLDHGEIMSMYFGH